MEDLIFFVVIFLIGFIGSFLSGLVGIGGSIIKYPMLLYIPPLLGLAAFTAHEVSGISAVQVFFATIGGVWAYRKGNFLQPSLIMYMGISILVGSLIGGYISHFFPEWAINLVYGVLATLAVILMLLPKKHEDKDLNGPLAFNKVIASVSALVVGFASGIVGAAGAFILVPIMLVVLKIPTRITIANSLAITLISSIGSTFGKLWTGQVLLVPSVIMIIASLLAAPLGAMVGKRTNAKVLQAILAVLILATTIKIWLDMLL